MKKRLLSVLMVSILVFSGIGNVIAFAAPKGEGSKSSKMKPWINSSIAGAVGLDVTENYKDDFYYAINHDWLRDAELPPGKSNYASIAQGEEIVKERCMDMLKDKNLSGHDAELIQNYYELRLDWDGRNEEGVEPIRPLFDSIKNADSIDELTKVLLSEDYSLFGYMIIPVGLGYDSENSSLYDVEIYDPRLLLGDSAEYSELTPNGERIKKYTDEVALYMLQRLGMTKKEAEEQLDLAYEFDKKTAKFIKSALDKEDPSFVTESINPVTISDIKKLSPEFPLPEYLEKYGWAESELINAQQPDNLKKFSSLYVENNLDEIKARILVGFANTYIDSLDEEAYRKYQELSNEKNGISESATDEEESYLETRAFFPDSFARIYIDRYLNEDIRNDITKICQDCIDTYDEMLSENTWLSEETIAAARKKLSKIRINAVYPDKWEDYSVYDVKSKEDGGTYFEAKIDYNKALRKKNIQKINTEKDPDIWVEDILMTNAYYMPADNSINIIPGFFSDVTYSEDMTTEEKYAGIGTVIGHEISHAFDTRGAQYDEDGNIKDWWTEEDKDAFSERAQKLIDYYDNVVPFDDGPEYHGSFVQTEAIADLAGFKCILKMAEKEDDFDYDKFFKAFEKLWARIHTQEDAERRAYEDVHPFAYLRGNVTVQQFDEFLETYDIKEGDGMYLAPEDRITVW
ncbi:MAG: M13 family metallopeptidase [Lachnospiraceae bacterium]|nr:M13 family metallopeptidase [Lachnospiraceae bacterium]